MYEWVCVHIYIYIQIQNFVVDNTEIRNQSHNEGMVVVLIVKYGCWTKKGMGNSKDSGKSSAEMCLDWIMKKWIGAHNAGGWEDRKSVV